MEKALQAVQDDSALARLRTGRQTALAEIFDDERSRLRRMVANRLDAKIAQRLDASDILQESFLAAVNSLDAYLKNPKLPPFLWLRGLVRKLILAQERFHGAAKRDPRLERRGKGSGSGPMLIELMTDSMASPASRLNRQEVAQRVRDAINKLHELDRQILDLHYSEEMTLVEISQELQLGYEAVKKRHIRALKQLRKRTQLRDDEVRE